MGLGDLLVQYACPEPVEVPDGCIPLPGGVVLCAQAGFETQDPEVILKGLFGQAQAGLAPFSPLFNLLEIAILIFKCLTSVVDAIKAVPPDPTKPGKCLEELKQKVDALLKLVPALSVPATARAVLNSIISFLRTMKAKIALFIAKFQRITAARLRAEEIGLDALKTELDCAESQLTLEFESVNKSLGPVNQLIAIVSAFMQIAGLGCIPAIGDFTTDFSQDLLSPIDSVISLLETIRDTIPDLDNSGGFGGGASDC